MLPLDGSHCLLRSSQPNHSQHVTCRRLRAGQGLRATTTWAGETPASHRAACGTTRWWRVGCDPPLPAGRGTAQIEALCLQVSLPHTQLLSHERGRHPASPISASTFSASHHKATTTFHQDFVKQGSGQRDASLVNISLSLGSWSGGQLKSCLKGTCGPHLSGSCIAGSLHRTTSLYTADCAHASCELLVCCP